MSEIKATEIQETTQIEELGIELQTLKSAFEQPRIHLHSHLSSLTNTVDIAFEKYQNKIGDRKCEKSIQACNSQLEIVGTIKSYEQECFAHLPTDKFEEGFSQLVLEKIKDCEVKLENLSSVDQDGLRSVTGGIRKTFFMVQKRIFGNKTLKFIDYVDHDENEIEDYVENDVEVDLDSEIEENYGDLEETMDDEWVYKRNLSHRKLWVIENQFVARKSSYGAYTHTTEGNCTTVGFVWSKTFTGVYTSEDLTRNVSDRIIRMKSKETDSNQNEGTSVIKINVHKDLINCISIHNEKFTSFEPYIFNGFKNLKKLQLFATSLSKIESNIFFELGNLKILNLERNNLKSLEHDVFIELGNLKELNLSYNHLTSLNSDAFKGVENLKYLNLGNNQITILNSNVFRGLGNLKILALSHNKLASLDPDWFIDLGNLKVLHLDDNQLTHLEPDIFNTLGNLKKIWLSENQFKSFQPNVFRGLASLVFLGLTQNQLSSLEPDVFSGLENLKTLLLNYNRFSTLESRSFRELGNLKKLYLAGNRLSFRNLSELGTVVGLGRSNVNGLKIVIP